MAAVWHLLLACHAQIGAPAADGAEAQRVRAVQRAVPRWNLNAQVVEARWCLPDEDGCQWGNYAASLFAASLSNFLLAGVFILIACCCCCNPHQLCFRWRASPGLPCCPGDELQFKGYRQSQVTTARLALFVTLVLLCLFSISGWNGREHVDAGIRQLAAALQQASQDVDSRVGSVVASTGDVLRRQAVRSPVPQPLAIDSRSLQRDAARLSAGLSRAGDVIVLMNTIRSAVLDVSLVMPLVTTFSGLVATLLNLGPVVGGWGVVTCLSTVLLWLSLVLHFPLIPLLCDLCDHVDDVLAAGAVSAIDSFTGCANGSTFALIDGSIARALQRSATLACAGLTAISQADGLDVSGLTCAARDLEIAARATGLTCNGAANVSLVECARSCALANLTTGCSPLDPPSEPLMRTAACTTDCRAAVVRDAVSFHSEYAELRDELEPLLQCRFVVETYDQVYSGMCVSLIVGLNSVSTAATTMGVTVIVALLVMTPLCKLFRKENLLMYRRYGLSLPSYVRARRNEMHAESTERAQLVTASAWRDLSGRTAPMSLTQLGRAAGGGTARSRSGSHVEGTA